MWSTPVTLGGGMTMVYGFAAVRFRTEKLVVQPILIPFSLHLSGDYTLLANSIYYRIVYFIT